MPTWVKEIQENTRAVKRLRRQVSWRHQGYECGWANDCWLIDSNNLAIKLFYNMSHKRMMHDTSDQLRLVCIDSDGSTTTGAS